MSLPDNLNLTLVESSEEAWQFMHWLGERRPDDVLGLDTETEGLDVERHKIRLIQFGDAQRGWAISWRDWRGLALDAISRWQGEWVFHNSKFDIRMIQKDRGQSVNDWPWHRTHDTMGMAHILDSQRPKGLKPLASMHVDGRAVQGEKALHEGFAKNGWDWDTVPIDYPPYWQYGALDPVLNAYMYEKFSPEVFQHRHLYDVEMGAIRVAARMEEIGMRVDLDYSKAKAEQLDEYVVAVRKHLREVYGIDNPTSGQLISFFNANGIPFMEKFTKGGALSMDKHVKQTIDHEVAKLALNHDKAKRMSGAYLHNFEKFAVDGVVHPNIQTMAARTGRMSITDPALQTLPRKDPIVRDAFIPRDGHSFLTIDADQIEARLTAHFSRDPGLITAFQSEEDFFCVIASQLFGYPVIKGMIERDLVKGVVYGKVYGASVEKMAETAGVTFQQMATTNALFDSTFSSVRTLMRDVVNAGKRRREEEGRGYVVTPYGRMLKADTGKEYTLVNYLIQCHASEILKSKLVALDAALGSEVLIVLPIHDEIVFDVPTEIVYDVKHEAEKVLNESSDYLVPITWSGDIMHRAWGSKYKGRFWNAELGREYTVEEKAA